MYYEVISEEKTILMNPCNMRLKKVLRNKPKLKVLQDIIIIGLFWESVERRNKFLLGNDGYSLSGK